MRLLCPAAASRQLGAIIRVVPIIGRQRESARRGHNSTIVRQSDALETRGDRQARPPGTLDLFSSLPSRPIYRDWHNCAAINRTTNKLKQNTFCKRDRRRGGASCYSKLPYDPVRHTRLLFLTDVISSRQTNTCLYGLYMGVRRAKPARARGTLVPSFEHN